MFSKSFLTQINDGLKVSRINDDVTFFNLISIPLRTLRWCIFSNRRSNKYNQLLYFAGLLDNKRTRYRNIKLLQISIRRINHQEMPFERPLKILLYLQNLSQLIDHTLLENSIPYVIRFFIAGLKVDHSSILTFILRLTSGSLTIFL